MSRMEYFLLHQHYDTLGNWITSSAVSYKQLHNLEMTLNPVQHLSFLLLWLSMVMVDPTITLVMALLNLDMLIAMQIAPSNSFVNPVERIMSILNLGLQGVALERKSAGKYETKLKACHSISDIL